MHLIKNIRTGKYVGQILWFAGKPEVEEMARYKASRYALDEAQELLKFLGGDFTIEPK